MSKFIQGDVIFRTTEKDVTTFKVIPDNVVVAGQNNHMLTGGTLVANGDNKFIISDGTATVVHPTHAPIVLPQGTYAVSMTMEYSHFDEEAKAVRD
jgi:hypothetical protein